MEDREWTGKNDACQSNGSYQNNGPFQNGAPYQNSSNAWQQPGGYPYSASPCQGQPVRLDSYENAPEEPVKMTDWLFTLLILSIPCVNLVMLFVWGFGSNGKRSKANFCKAALIWMGVCYALVFVLYLVIIAGFLAGVS